MEQKIKEALAGIVHPETGRDIVSSGIVQSISAGNGKVAVELEFAKKRDPFTNSIKRQVAQAVAETVPGAEVEVTVKEAPAPEKQEQASTTVGIKRVIAIASGKGGVGKSTVTANLAVTLRDMGYRVGILDADIYGPSMPKMFGVESQQPEAIVGEGGEQYMIPIESQGIKLTSIGFFIGPDDALVWRGPMANSALKQLIHQTLWDELDYLLIDLPPGTGDVHLSILSELKVDGAVIVSTPQQVAIADVRRGIKMFRTQGIDVPVLGIVENMAWFTPAELPDNKYYIFGQGGAQNLARTEGIDLLGEIPIIQSVMEGADAGKPAVADNSAIKKHYAGAAAKIVDKLPVK